MLTDVVFGHIGDLFNLNFFVHEFFWYPWVYNIIITGLFILDTKSIFDSYWGIFWPMLIFLTFRNGFAVTYYQAKIVARNPNDSNCVIIGNFAKESGNAFGAFISVFILMVKGFVHRT